MNKNTTVGKCSYCDDPIYKFQVDAHGGCIRALEFNPDYLDFDKGVEVGRLLERKAIRKEQLVKE